MEDERLTKLRILLDEAAADYEILPHEATYLSAEHGAAHGVGRLAQMAPTFILRTENGFLTAIVSGATRLSYKKTKKRLGLRNVALAPPQIVKEVTGSEIGTVSLVQPETKTILDEALVRENTGYGGCGVPRHTLRIRIADLVRFDVDVVDA